MRNTSQPILGRYFDIREVRGVERTLEQSNQRVGTRASVEPQCQRGSRCIVHGLEEQEEHIGSLIETNVARVRIDSRGSLTDT